MVRVDGGMNLRRGGVEGVVKKYCNYLVGEHHKSLFCLVHLFFEEIEG